MVEANKAITVLAQGAEQGINEPVQYSPWWRDKKRLTKRLCDLIHNSDRDADDLILAAIVDRAKTDRHFRQKLKGIMSEVSAGRRGGPVIPSRMLRAIFLQVEAERRVLNRSQKDAFVSVGRCYNLSEFTIEKHYLAGKKLCSTEK